MFGQCCAAKTQIDIEYIDDDGQAAKPCTTKCLSDGERFRVQLRRCYRKLGLQLDAFGGKSMFIIGVSTSPTTALGEHNARSSPEMRVGSGDFIVQVNGSTDTAIMGKILAGADGGDVDMVVVRPAVVRTAINKRDSSDALGLEMKFWRSGSSVLIVDIEDDGIVALSGCDICPGDRIVAANDARGKPEAIIEKLRKQERTELEIYRCFASGN